VASHQGDVDRTASRKAGVHLGKRNWGYQLRFGLFEISDADMPRIAQAMGASLV
jgi:hypothetical protein